jgi:Putative peptidoglycan binding domain
MGALINHDAPLSSWIRRELELKQRLKKGDRGPAVRRAQEWLNLNHHRITIDNDFGPATEAAVRAFQQSTGLKEDGIVGPITYAALVKPLRTALSPLPAKKRSFAAMTLAYAKRHLALHPLEIGGQNCGPWVRLYVGGNQGTDWAWCAGFITFVMQQAAQTLDTDMPIRGSVSCDTLAAQAKEAGRFVSEADIRNGAVSVHDLPTAGLFLVRRTRTDWVHTGLVTAFETEFFQTIEGNTNDEGQREGYEVCARTRGYPGKDFIRL